MVKILALSGSLRAGSSNTRLVKAIAQLDSESISLYTGMGDLPHFNPDLDDSLEGNRTAPSSVQQWRAQLTAADGVLICTPEYAHGVPGVLKNALDWIVSSGEFVHKPTAVISASPSMDGGDKANASLVQTLKMMMAAIAPENTLCIPGISTKVNQQCEITDTSLLDALTQIVRNLKQ